MSINSRFKEVLVRNPRLTNFILKTFQKTGFDLANGINPAAALLSKYGINLIFDVGANVGQYARRQRAICGYQGQIVSFEPISSIFSELTKNAKNDPLWIPLNLALGNYDGEASINVSEHSVYSSLLKALPDLSPPPVKEEKITIKKLDSLFSDYYKDGDKVLLKVDTQGYEKNVLEGAYSSLEYITGIQLELSFVRLYEGEPLLIDMINLLLEKGFTLVNLEPLNHQLKSPGKILQADGMFFRLN
jgi:FkbM family methyltransferase